MSDVIDAAKVLAKDEEWVRKHIATCPVCKFCPACATVNCWTLEVAVDLFVEQRFCADYKQAFEKLKTFAKKRAER